MFLGGWVGFKELMVSKREEESKGITSFYFVHTDGSRIPDNFRPGQFLAIKIPKSAFGGKYDHDFDWSQAKDIDSDTMKESSHFGKLHSLRQSKRGE